MIADIAPYCLIYLAIGHAHVQWFHDVPDRWCMLYGWPGLWLVMAVLLGRAAIGQIVRGA